MQKPVYTLSHAEVVATRPDLVERELALEEEAADVGIERVLKSIDRKGYATGSRSGARMLRTSTIQTAAAIDLWITGREKLNRKHPMLSHIKALDSEQLAFIVSRILIDGVSKQQVVWTRACVSVGRRVQQVVEYGIFKEANEGLAVKLERQLASSTSGGHRRAVLSKAFKSADFEGLQWDDATHASIGHILISAFIEASGLFYRVVTKARNKSTAYVQPSDEMNALLASGELTDALSMPYHYPMVIPPRDWTTVYDGGYLDLHLHGLRMVKTGDKNLHNLDATDLRDVNDSLNAIQATPWAINAKVLEVLDFLNSVGGSVAGLTSSDIPDLLEKPWGDLEDDAWDAFRNDPKNADDIKTYKRNAAIQYQARAKWASKRFVQKQQIVIAERFRDEEAIYFPHTVDYRGRIYPAAGLGSVNPQGNDSGKALLRFARGKALGETGALWLAIHCANVYGKDKVTMQDRVLWAHMNTDMMLACAADPMANNSWMDADKPMQFLAACFEWAGYCAEGDAFVSHLPVALDGTCSGMQHYSAMVRDPEGAKHVNVLQVGELPADLYTKVLENVLAHLPEGSEWSTRLTRKIVKQPCMTTPYGVTISGIRGQIENWTRRALDEGSCEPFSGDLKEAVASLAPEVDNGIRGTVGAAREVMDWLQAVAKITATAGHAMSWTTPNGFTVNQAYMTTNTKRVNVSWDGVSTFMSLLSGTKELSVGDCVRGIAPNFVHSYDACHLQITVANMVENDVNDFAMIHDSFAVHACDTQLLAEVLRESFIAMYEGDTLGNLMIELEQQLPAAVFSELPAPPAMGTLDINCVRDSEYFFA